MSQTLKLPIFLTVLKDVVQISLFTNVQNLKVRWYTVLVHSVGLGVGVGIAGFRAWRLCPCVSCGVLLIQGHPGQGRSADEEGTKTAPPRPLRRTKNCGNHNSGEAVPPSEAN